MVWEGKFASANSATLPRMGVMGFEPTHRDNPNLSARIKFAFSLKIKPITFTHDEADKRSDVGNFKES